MVSFYQIMNTHVSRVLSFGTVPNKYISTVSFYLHLVTCRKRDFAVSHKHVKRAQLMCAMRQADEHRQIPGCNLIANMHSSL